MVTNAKKQTLWHWEGDAFGDVQPQVEHVKMPLRFAGQYSDDEVGLFYNYFRFYNPETGRYVENDPIDLQGGLNRYGYVSANPLHNIDPTGESPLVIPVVAVAGGIAVTGGVICYAIGCGDAFVNAVSGVISSIGNFMASHGNQADTRIENDWINTDDRCDGKRPDKCEWLEKNQHKYPRAAVKATQKAWGCRHSRISKDKK